MPCNEEIQQNIHFCESSVTVGPRRLLSPIWTRASGHVWDSDTGDDDRRNVQRQKMSSLPSCLKYGPYHPQIMNVLFHSIEAMTSQARRFDIIPKGRWSDWWKCCTITTYRLLRVCFLFSFTLFFKMKSLLCFTRSWKSRGEGERFLCFVILKTGIYSLRFWGSVAPDAK